MNEFGEFVRVLPLLALATGSFAVWTRIVRRLRRGQAVLALAPRRDVPWTGADVLVFALLHVGLGGALVLALHYLAPSVDVKGDNLLRDMLVSSAVKMVATIAGLLYLHGAARASARDFGWGSLEMRDLTLGLAAFLALSLPAYAIQLLLTQLVDFEHRVVTLLDGATEVRTILAVVASVVIVAPLCEELAFRAVLQGWLEARELAWLRTSAPESAAVASGDPATNPYAPPPPDNPRGASPERRWWAVSVSAAIFAALHLGQGPAPVALFVYALGLGYVYQCTHRLAPVVLAHLALNGFSLYLLWAFPPP
jgi:membrane protease YdiL (CAAX protease family)